MTKEIVNFWKWDFREKCTNWNETGDECNSRNAPDTKTNPNLLIILISLKKMFWKTQILIEYNIFWENQHCFHQISYMTIKNIVLKRYIKSFPQITMSDVQKKVMEKFVDNKRKYIFLKVTTQENGDRHFTCNKWISLDYYVCYFMSFKCQSYFWKI